MEENMASYFIEKPDEKKAKIKKVVSMCFDMMKKSHVRTCDKKKEDFVETIAELVTDEEARSLFEIAKSNDFQQEGAKLDDKSFDKENFWKSFYHIVLPTVIIDYSDFDRNRKERTGNDRSVWGPNYSSDFDDEIRYDFLRYVVLRYSSRKNVFAEKISEFNSVFGLYQFAADAVQDLLWYESSDSKADIVYNNVTLCFYKVFSSLLTDTDFLEATLEQITPNDLYGILYVYGSGPYLGLFKKLKIRNSPEKIEFSLFQPDVRKKIAEIFFSSEKTKKVISIDKNISEMFFMAIKNLDPDFVETAFFWVAEREVKKIKIRNELDLFDLGKVSAKKCRDYTSSLSEKNKHLLLAILLRDKVLEDNCFKRLPEFFQKMLVVEQMRSIFKKAEIVVVPDIPATDIDKDKLKKDVDNFMSELKKIAKSGGKPSDYYANEPFDSIKDVLDSESVTTIGIFRTAVKFLWDSFGAWKAVKPVLAIFRNLKEQAYAIDMKPYEDFRYLWAFVPLRLTPLLGSLEGEEAAKVCEEWFKYLAGELKSADDFAINKRKENPENVPEEFKEGYDINVIEPHPLWREAYCEAAGDLRVNLGFNNCKVFNHLKKNDIDKDVREAAEKTLERIGKIKGKFDSGSRKRALLNAWWWYRVAHLKSLGIDFDWVAAQNLKIKEVKINYPKN